MSNHTKQYDNLNEMLLAAQTMGKFQRIHNVIRPDFMLLLKITEEQKQLILQKREEMHDAREAKRESNASLTPEERKSQMEAKKTELEKWAKENGIDMQYLMLGGRGHGGFKGMGNQN